MGCCHTKHSLLIPLASTYDRIICDLASRIAIDLISVYSDNMHSSLEIYMDNTHYLFGKRIVKSVSINDCQKQIPILRYQIDIQSVNQLVYTNKTPLDHLKEYLAMHNLLTYPVNIEFTIKDSSFGYFDIRLNELS
jgi:hypothetical protein